MRTPLHGKATKSEVLDLHIWANRTNPNGFRKPPTSRKNPRTHSSAPATRIEKMSKEVYGK